MFDWFRNLFKRRPDPWEQQWRDTVPTPERQQAGRFVPPRPLPQSARVNVTPNPLYAKPPAPPRPPPAVTYIERRDAAKADVPINRDNDYLLGLATATMLSSVHSDEKPASGTEPGGGGDFGGGGASGSWDTDASSTSSISSND